MGARTKARKGALDILYESEMRGLAPGGSLAERQATDPSRVRDYTVELVTGVAEHCAEIDELIGAHAQGWTLDRMPAVDRNLLRIAVYELSYARSVPAPVVINEAVSLATELSTDASPSFVNGVLAAVAARSDSTIE
jgi:transcription antitermination protein NusB